MGDKKSEPHSLFAKCWRTLCILCLLSVLLAIFLFLQRIHTRHQFWEKVAQLQENDKRFKRDFEPAFDKYYDAIHDQFLPEDPLKLKGIYNRRKMNDLFDEKLNDKQQALVFMYISEHHIGVYKLMKLANSFPKKKRDSMFLVISGYFKESYFKEPYETWEEDRGKAFQTWRAGKKYLTYASEAYVFHILCDKFEQIHQDINQERNKLLHLLF